MDKPKHHIFVCASFRTQGAPQGMCHKKESLNLIPYLKNELADRSMSNVAVSATACLNLCEKGPVLVVYPENFWCGEIDSEEKVNEILDALEEGEACENHIINRELPFPSGSRGSAMCSLKTHSIPHYFCYSLLLITYRITRNKKKRKWLVFLRFVITLYTKRFICKPEYWS